MESKNTFILHETEAFMRGELDNVTVAHGRIVLDLVSGGYVPYGCYTSAGGGLSLGRPPPPPPYRCPPLTPCA